uniref:Small ribosomal subunit protein mS33 n=1 Tax=Artemia franciscana TaxID=6661 RepID=B5BV16_ARTSF|nr:mitochondrial 28S ribosomal protein S33 [Artemia franciscana]
MSGGFYNYLTIMNSATNYGKRMTRLSNRIFGEVVKPTPVKSLKVVRIFSEQPLNKKEEFYNYYPRHVETYELMKHLRLYGLYRDEHQDFKEEMKRLRRLRGKGPPKKGEGKRASKK